MENEYTHWKCFSECVKGEMSAKNMTQAELERKSLLSATTISRICRNSNDKKSTYKPTLPVVCAVSIGLGLNREKATDLLFSAFPEIELWGDFLDKRLDIDDVNAILYENGLTLWGNPEE